MLLNARGGRREVEYLCYTSGRLEKQPATMRGQQAQLLSQLLKVEIGPEQIDAFVQPVQSDDAAQANASTGTAHIGRI